MKIPSFEIDHTRLKRGVYVSRIDEVGNDAVTTYDIRIREPYLSPPMDGAAMHTIEHIGAAILRNGIFRDDVVYFGPMGCRTGFYLILKGYPHIEYAVSVISAVFSGIAEWTGPVPGATERECGNHEYHDLVLARIYAGDFLKCRWNNEYPE